MGFDGPPERLLDPEGESLTYAGRYLRGAWLVSYGDNRTRRSDVVCAGPIKLTRRRDNRFALLVETGLNDREDRAETLPLEGQPVTPRTHARAHPVHTGVRRSGEPGVACRACRSVVRDRSIGPFQGPFEYPRNRSRGCVRGRGSSLSCLLKT